MRNQRKARVIACAMALLTAMAPLSALAEGTATTVLSPTTGLPTDKPYRPVLANVANREDGRPAWNLSEADIVYESIIWGPGYTRYLALYNDHHPEYVGSMRGLRAYQAEMREAWDCPLVHRGGQSTEGTSVYMYYKTHSVDDTFAIDPMFSNEGQRQTGTFSDVFSTRKESSHPFNHVANIARVVEAHWPANEDGTPYEPRLPGLRFSDTPSRGDADALAVEIQYGVVGTETYDNPRFTFNKEERVYERWYNDAPYTDAASGKRLAASNVIVQVCEVAYFQDNPARAVVDTIGEGPFDAFIDGRHISGTWHRIQPDKQTEYLDENGEPLVLLPGKTFIQIIPPDLALDERTAKDGTYRFKRK